MQVLFLFFVFFPFFFSGDSSCRVVFLVIRFLIVILFYFLFFAKTNFLCSTRGHNFMHLIFSVDQGDYSTLVLGGPLQNSA